MSKINTIAVINLGFVGDIVNASPITKALKEKYPDSKLIFITVPKSREIASKIPGVDEVIIYDKDVEHKGIKMLPLVASVRFKYKIDMVILLNETFRSALFAYLTGAKTRVGHASEGRGFLLNKTVPWLQEEKDLKMHISKIYMRNLDAIGLYKEDYELEFNFTKEDEKYIENLIKDVDIQDKELVGLCPCARYSSKDWTPDEAKKFIDYINQDENKKVVIIGQESGKEFAEKLKQIGCTNFIDFNCKTNISQLAALISKFKVFVSVDTAPMHLSFAVKTPTVAIFKQDNHEKWGPVDKKLHRLIYAPPKMDAELIIKAFEELKG